MYNIPAKLYRTEETIKRSRFIATVAHAFTEEDAKAFISIIKRDVITLTAILDY
jgi:putative IMPACT (imprinted ancient) family translation regulator